MSQPQQPSQQSGMLPAQEQGGATGRTSPHHISSSYVPFSEYLKGGTGTGMGLANQLSGNVEKGAQAAQSQLGTLTSGFNSAADKGTNSFALQYPQAQAKAPANPASRAPQERFDDGSQGQGKGGFNISNYYGRPSGTAASSSATPWGNFQQATNSPESVATAAGAGYSGPKSLAEYDSKGWENANQTGMRAASQLKGLQSNEGLQGLLQGQYGNSGEYSSGMSALDAALAGNAGRSQFSGLQDKYGGLEKQFTDADKAAGDRAGAAITSSDAASKSARDYQSAQQTDDVAHNDYVNKLWEQKDKDQVEAQRQDDAKRDADPQYTWAKYHYGPEAANKWWSGSTNHSWLDAKNFRG